MKSHSEYVDTALNVQGSAQKNLELIQQIPENYCSNEKSPSAMSTKEYLKEFAKGPCSPTIVLPGLLSVKLVVSIDCEELRVNDPDAFAVCGWNACQKKSYEVSVGRALTGSFGKASRIRSI